MSPVSSQPSLSMLSRVAWRLFQYSFMRPMPRHCRRPGVSTGSSVPSSSSTRRSHMWLGLPQEPGRSRYSLPPMLTVMAFVSVMPQPWPGETPAPQP